jgi:endonuclease-3
MTRQQRYQYLLDYFRRQMPHVTTELHFGSAFQLLCATVLSAQCTDKRVNMVTPALFAAYPTAQAMSQATADDLLAYVSSVSYPNSKARHLAELSRMIVEQFGGEVPSTVEELVKLPGVGRKTANVMQAVWFGKAAMAVDTHVYRVSHRMGLVPKTADNPLKVEKYLMAHIPADDIPDAHHWLLLHGRYVSRSQHPRCSECAFADICPRLIEGSKLE